MTIKRLEIYGIVAAVLLTLVGATLYITKAVSTARTQGAVQQVLDGARPAHEANQEAATKVNSNEAASQAALQVALAALTKQQQSPVDYDRVAALVASKLGAGFQVQASKPSSPGGPETVTITGPGASQTVRDDILDCDKKDLLLGACKTTISNVTESLAIEKADHKVTKDELTATQKQVNGTFWRRMGAGVTHSACGGGGTAAGFQTAKHSSVSSGIAVGGIAFGGCELLTWLNRRH